MESHWGPKMNFPLSWPKKLCVLGLDDLIEEVGTTFLSPGDHRPGEAKNRCFKHHQPASLWEEYLDDC